MDKCVGGGKGRVRISQNELVPLTVFPLQISPATLSLITTAGAQQWLQSYSTSMRLARRPSSSLN